MSRWSRQLPKHFQWDAINILVAMMVWIACLMVTLKLGALILLLETKLVTFIYCKYWQTFGILLKMIRFHIIVIARPLLPIQNFTCPNWKLLINNILLVSLFIYCNYLGNIILTSTITNTNYCLHLWFPSYYSNTGFLGLLVLLVSS